VEEKKVPPLVHQCVCVVGYNKKMIKINFFFIFLNVHAEENEMIKRMKIDNSCGVAR
jgi:hypothetical protein